MKYVKLFEDFSSDLATAVINATRGFGTDEASLVKAVLSLKSVADLANLDAVLTKSSTEYKSLKDAINGELGVFDRSAKEQISKKLTELGLPNYLKDGIIPPSLDKSKPTPRQPKQNLGPTPKIMVCAHAAKWDGGGGSPAENCLTNVIANVKNGTDMIEIDIQITADGVPVLFHDGSLNNKTNGNGRIQNLTWDQVSKIQYNSDPSQTICSLEQVVNVIKKAGSPIIIQLDKCDSRELDVISRLGILNGMGNQVIAKGFSSSAPSAVKSMGIGWMQILPTEHVGQVTTGDYADSIASRASSKYVEYQFSDSDEYITNGYLTQALNDKGIRVMVVAVGGTENTNGRSYRGDSSSAWKKIIDDLGPNIIMTNRPSQLKSLVGR